MHGRCLELLLHLYLGEGLYHVACLYIVEVDERDTTLKACGNLLDVILITLQSVDFACEDYDTITDKTCLILSMLPSVTIHPATAPTLEILKTSLTST